MPLDNPNGFRTRASVYLGRRCEEKAGNYRDDRSSASAISPLSLSAVNVEPRERERGEKRRGRTKGKERKSETEVGKAVRIMTRRVSFETTCKQRCKHSEERKRVEMGG